MSDPRLTTQIDEVKEAHEVTVRRKNVIIWLMAVLALLGWPAWQIAQVEQEKAVTNAKVAKAGVSAAEEVAKICESGSPQAKAELHRLRLCQEVARVASLAPSIDAPSAEVAPTMVRVPADAETVTVAARSPLFTVPTVFGEKTVEVTRTAPGRTVAGPGVTRTVTEPGVVQTVTGPGVVVTETVRAPGAVTTEVVTVPGAPVTEVVTVPGERVTETVTIPGPEQTITITVTAPAPPETSTATEPPVTTAATETVPGSTETVTETVTPGV